MQTFNMNIFILESAAQRLDRCAFGIHGGLVPSHPCQHPMLLTSFQIFGGWIVVSPVVWIWCFIMLNTFPHKYCTPVCFFSDKGTHVLWSMFVYTCFSTIVSFPNQFLILNYKYLSHCTLSFSIILSGDPTSVSWTLSKSFVPSSTPSSAIYS